ncbi:MAG: hypothetical protein LBS55_12160 [Prevotellaceae bacterium]|jgi:hypothetical protein|nr:hypothetical protein [Prevotellaceae bacterium]
MKRDKIFLLVLFVGVTALSWGGGEKDTGSGGYSTNSGPNETNTLDSNGLRPEDYDSNGWAYKDGKWVASPRGAVKGQKQAKLTIHNKTGKVIQGIAVSADDLAEPLAYSCSIQDGYSYELIIEKMKSYEIAIVDEKEQIYIKKDCQFFNDSEAITITKKDLTYSRFDQVMEQLTGLWIVLQPLLWKP